MEEGKRRWVARQHEIDGIHIILITEINKTSSFHSANFLLYFQLNNSLYLENSK